MSDGIPASATDDVRMRGFLRRWTVEEALAWLDRHLTRLSTELIPLSTASDRVLAEDVYSSVDVPGFERSMMDGFAVRADDTSGATVYNRLNLQTIGQSLPGMPFAGQQKMGQTVRIMTGAPLPAGADAVLPVEKVEVAGNDIAVLDEVSPGKNVGRRGEDIASGILVLRSGRKLRPQDLGVLSSIGVSNVNVVQQPRVRLVVTGNELLPAGSTPRDSRISDANGPMLAALVTRDGGLSADPGIVPDEPDSILDAMRDECDVVIVSGGSSVGQEDHAPNILATHGELAIHGVAMRPSSPVGMGRLDGRLVFLLPGNPVSCLCAYDFFAGRAIRALGGRSTEWPYRSRQLPLRRKLVSAVGRFDYARVCVMDGQVEPVAISGASVLSSTTRADGFVVIPADSEGYSAGTGVDVYFYD